MENLILMSYNCVKKGGTVMREYKRDLIKMLYQINNKEYLDYIYALLKTFLEK